LVVLTPAELGLAEQKLGRIFARTITLFVLNHAGTQGFVVWTTGNWDGAWKAYPATVGGV
jgi:hypothetical protein